MTVKRLGVLVLFLSVLCSLGAQRLYQDEFPEEYEPDEFPSWAYDLRRFEIIAIGSLPLTFLATSFIYDFSIYAAHGFQPGYQFGTQRSNQDIQILMLTSVGVSLLLATADLIVGHVMKKRQSQGEPRRTESLQP